MTVDNVYRDMKKCFVSRYLKFLNRQSFVDDLQIKKK